MNSAGLCAPEELTLIARSAKPGRVTQDGMKMRVIISPPIIWALQK